MEEEPSGLSPLSSSAPAPRQVRARRRRRRRQIGTVLFIVAAIAVFGAAYLALTSGDDSSDDAANAARTTTLAPTTTIAKPLGPYKVTTGVNVRQSPGTAAAVVGTIETGRAVFVACVIDGDVVEGPNGPNAKWLRIVGLGPNGYLTTIYVDTGDDLRNSVIPTCSAP